MGPERNATSARVALRIVTLPATLDTNTLFASRFEDTIVVAAPAAPVIAICLASSCACTLDVILAIVSSIHLH